MRLYEDGIPAELLSGELAVEQRAAFIKRSRDSHSKMLVTTNVTAKGDLNFSLFIFILVLA